MGGALIRLVLALVAAAALCTAATDVSLVRNSSENAYATIFYEGTPRDYEYFLGARVAMYSIKKAGSTQDRIVFVSENVRKEWRDIFESDGLRVIQVDNVANPYTENAKFLDRFKYSLNKLYAWALTQYRRVIMLDADVIAIKNPDELFLCGHFCALFMNPCHFHTGLLVLKPEKVHRHRQSVPSSRRPFRRSLTASFASSRRRHRTMQLTRASSTTPSRISPMRLCSIPSVVRPSSLTSACIAPALY